MKKQENSTVEVREAQTHNRMASYTDVDAITFHPFHAITGHAGVGEYGEDETFFQIHFDGTTASFPASKHIITFAKNSNQPS